jgi:tryptophan synthase beta chain
MTIESVRQYVNIQSACEPSILSRRTGALIQLDELAKVLPRSIAELELLRDAVLDIPAPVLDIYSKFRPTPLKRAAALEKAIATSCEIYYKDEGKTPSGTHKSNSAYLIAYLCARDGFRTIATETTGSWGIALSLAAREFGIRCVCFIDEVSNQKREDLKPTLESLGAEVVVVECDGTTSDYLTLTANAAIQYVRQRSDATYIFGSIFGYFIIPQSLVGLEAKLQLGSLGKYPDIVIGSCGGGANFLGTCAPFLLDYLQGRSNVAFIAAEAESAPIVSGGRHGAFSVDELAYYPPLRTCGLPTMGVDGEYIGGLGSRVVASAVAEFHAQGIVEAMTISHQEAIETARLFHQTEGEWVALESSYTLAAAVCKAKSTVSKCLLLNISSGERDKHFFG